MWSRLTGLFRSPPESQLPTVDYAEVVEQLCDELSTFGAECEYLPDGYQSELLRESMSHTSQGAIAFRDSPIAELGCDVCEICDDYSVEWHIPGERLTETWPVVRWQFNVQESMWDDPWIEPTGRPHGSSSGPSGLDRVTALLNNDPHLRSVISAENERFELWAYPANRRWVLGWSGDIERFPSEFTRQRYSMVRSIAELLTDSPRP